MPSSEDGIRLRRQLHTVERLLLSIISRAPDAARFDILPSSDEGEAVEIDDSMLGTLASKIYNDRRKRAEHLPAILLGEPGWDILLDLYIAEKRNRLVTVGDACLASNAPHTTAQRVLRTLEDSALIKRSPDVSDKRRIYVALTRKAEHAVTSYLKTMAPGWLR